jgi:CheY-like chemotaxis protein
MADSKRVLIVNDRRRKLGALIRCFRADEYSHVELSLSSNVERAWDLVCTEDFDCVVLEAMLPTKIVGVTPFEEGISLARWIRGLDVHRYATQKARNILLPPPSDLRPRDRQVPIIIFTARDLSKMMEMGVDLDFATGLARMSGDVNSVAEMISMACDSREGVLSY